MAFEIIPQGYPLWTLIVQDNELAPALIVGWRYDLNSEAVPDPVMVVGRGTPAGLYLTESEARAEKDKVESEEYR